MEGLFTVDVREGMGLAERVEFIDEQSGGGVQCQVMPAASPPCLHDATRGQRVGDLAGAG